VGVSRGKPPTTRHSHPLLLSRCDGSGGGEMPGFEAYNHHPTTPPLRLIYMFVPHKRPIWRSISAWYS